MVRGAGFEPATSTDKQRGKSPLTHRATHQASDLVKISLAWPSLSPALKAAILAIVGSVSPEEVKP